MPRDAAFSATRAPRYKEALFQKAPGGSSLLGSQHQRPQLGGARVMGCGPNKKRSTPPVRPGRRLPSAGPEHLVSFSLHTAVGGAVGKIRIRAPNWLCPFPATPKPRLGRETHPTPTGGHTAHPHGPCTLQAVSETAPTPPTGPWSGEVKKHFSNTIPQGPPCRAVEGAAVAGGWAGLRVSTPLQMNRGGRAGAPQL